MKCYCRLAREKYKYLNMAIRFDIFALEQNNCRVLRNSLNYKTCRHSTHCVNVLVVIIGNEVSTLRVRKCSKAL